MTSPVVHRDTVDRWEMTVTQRPRPGLVWRYTGPDGRTLVARWRRPRWWAWWRR